MVDIIYTWMPNVISDNFNPTDAYSPISPHNCSFLKHRSQIFYSHARRRWSHSSFPPTSRVSPVPPAALHRKLEIGCGSIIREQISENGSPMGRKGNAPSFRKRISLHSSFQFNSILRYCTIISGNVFLDFMALCNICHVIWFFAILKIITCHMNYTRISPYICDACVHMKCIVNIYILLTFSLIYKCIFFYSLRKI